MVTFFTSRLKEFGLIAILLIFFSCQQPHDNKPIRIGYNPWPGYEFIYLAEQKGFYQKYNIQIELLQFESLNDNRRAFERGQVNGMGATVIEVLQAASMSNRNPKIVYIPDYSNGGDVILSKQNIASIVELKGKRVAIEPGTLNLFLLYRALSKHGLALADLEVISMPQSNMELAFAKNEIDAVVSYPPFSVNIVNNQQAKALFTSKEIPGEIIDVLVFDEHTVRKRPEVIAGILRAYDEAVAYAAANSAESYAIMAEREGISVSDFTATVEEDLKILRLSEQIPYFSATGILAQNIDNVQTMLFQMNEISKTFDPNQLIDVGPVRLATRDQIK